MGKLDLQRITAKLFVADPGAVGPGAAELIPVFHRWIQAGDLSGLPIDVADYGHVQDGPGVMLIGHEADRALDFWDGRAGFSYQRKREAVGTTRERLAQALREAAEGALRIEGEDDLGVAFRGDELQLRIADRLQAPNTPETLAALSADIVGAVSDVFPDATAGLIRQSDARRPFTVAVALSGAPADGLSGRMALASGAGRVGR
jgi:hypothetical protein